MGGGVVTGFLAGAVVGTIAWLTFARCWRQAAPQRREWADDLRTRWAEAIHPDPEHRAEVEAALDRVHTRLTGRPVGQHYRSEA